MRQISAHGMADVTLAGLARELNTSAGHLLYYFKTKDGLLTETLRWSEAQLDAPREAIRASRAKPEAKLRRFVDLYLATGTGDPRWLLWVELWARSLRDESLRAAQLELEFRWRDDLIELLLVAGHTRSAAERTATCTLAMLDGFSVAILTGNPDVSPKLAHSHAAELLEPIG